MFVVPCKLCGNMPTLQQHEFHSDGDFCTWFTVVCRNHPDMTVSASVSSPWGYPRKEDRYPTYDQAHAAAWHAWNEAHGVTALHKGKRVRLRMSPQTWANMYDSETRFKWLNALDARRRPNH